MPISGPWLLFWMTRNSQSGLMLLLLSRSLSPHMNLVRRWFLQLASKRIHNPYSENCNWTSGWKGYSRHVATWTIVNKELMFIRSLRSPQTHRRDRLGYPQPQHGGHGRRFPNGATPSRCSVNPTSGQHLPMPLFWSLPCLRALV